MFEHCFHIQIARLAGTEMKIALLFFDIELQPICFLPMCLYINVFFFFTSFQPQIQTQALTNNQKAVRIYT